MSTRLQGAWLRLVTFLEVQGLTDRDAAVHTQRLHAKCQSKLIELANKDTDE